MTPGKQPVASNLPAVTGVRWFMPDELTEELSLSGACAGHVDTFTREAQEIDRFVDAGVDASNKVLFWGPSGTGKTLAARWIAQRLDKPLAVVDVGEIISKWHGETSNNLVAIFKLAGKMPIVLFLDEVEGVCTKRGATSGGAADKDDQRQTTVLLQHVDWMPPTSILIAATNFRAALDTALLRRLTVQIEFELPDIDARRKMIGRWLAKVPIPDEVLDQLAAKGEGMSGADLRSTAMAVARRAILAAPAPPKVDRALKRKQEFQRSLKGFLEELEELDSASGS